MKTKEFRELIKETIYEILMEEKSFYEVSDVYVMGKRVGGQTYASSDKQAVTNIVIRHLPDNLKRSPGAYIAKANELRGFKIKRAEKNPVSDTTDSKKYWWNDKD